MDADRIAAVVEAEIRRSRIPGAALAVVLGGNIAMTRGFGVASIETSEPMTPNTAFSVQSLTKPIVTTALMQILERGAFSLDDPVEKHLPGLIKNQWQDEHPVTIRSLLTHTSGLPEDTTNPGTAEGTPLREFIASVAQTVRRAGQDMIYANWGYDTVGLLVERFSGVSWDRYVLDNVCGPLGMQTTFVGAAYPGAPFASGHFLSAVDDRLHPLPPISWPTVPPAPSAAAYSTIEDMAEFLAAHLGSGRAALDPETIAEMHSLHAAHGPARSGMGLGFRITYSNGRLVACHGGDGAGLTNFIGLYPDAGAGIVLTLNRGGAQSARSIIANTVLGMLVEPRASEVSDFPALSDCDGRYESSYWGIEASVTADGDATFTLEDGLVVSDYGEKSGLAPAPDGRLTGSGGMLHGFEVEIDRTSDGIHLYGGVYPFRFDRTGDLEPPDVLDETADVAGSWSGTLRTPLGVMPAQVRVDDETHAFISTPLGQNIPLDDCEASAGRISARFEMTVPGAGQMQMHPRLFISGSRLRGAVFAQGWFGEVRMRADLGRV